MQDLKQSTAIIFRIGPFVDSTDGVTAETGLTIAQADIQISKAGGAFAQTSEATPTTTHDTDGWYQCPLTTTDTATLGLLDIQIVETGALPVWRHFMVLPANVWDSRYSTDKLQVDITQLVGADQSATDLKDFADAGYDPGTNKVQGVVLVDTTTTNTDMVGTNSAALASVCTEGRLAELDAGNLPTDIAAIPDAAAINAEVVDALATDTYAEPGQGAPPATASIEEKLSWLFLAFRNKITETESEQILFADDGTTEVCKAAMSDDATTFTKGEMATGT